MAKNQSISERVLKALGTAKTKESVADKLGVSFGYVSRTINDLVADGLVAQTKVKSMYGIGRPAAYFKRV
jgi:predicted ArsR family transcriptional regulator